MNESVANLVPVDTHIAAAAERSGSVRSIKHFSSGSLLSVETGDFDEFRHYAQGWSIEHQLRGLGKPHSAISGVLTPSSQIAVVQHSIGYCSQGRNPQGTLSIAVPLDDRPMIYRGQVLRRMQMPLIRNPQGFELVCDSGAHFIVATVAEAAVQRYAAEVRQKPMHWRRPTDRLSFTDASRQMQFVDALTSLLSSFEAVPTLLNEPNAGALLEEKLLECLPLDAHVDSQTREDRGRYRVAREAYGFLHDRIDNVLSIRDLCVMTGASYATLERGFREMYGLSPKILMQELRLSRARSALLQPSPSTTVTAVALRCGFLEFGRFAVQYRLRFGEVPSETLKRASGYQ